MAKRLIRVRRYKFHIFGNPRFRRGYVVICEEEVKSECCGWCLIFLIQSWGRQKTGLEYSSIGSVPVARKGRFFNEGCLHSVVLFAKYQTSKYPRIYNYFASCCQTPNLPIPIDLLLQVTPGHARLAHKYHTALSDFERLLLIVNFQSHKYYSEDLPRSPR